MTFICLFYFTHLSSVEFSYGFDAYTPLDVLAWDEQSVLYSAGCPECAPDIVILTLQHFATTSII
jgi:hypothetical protein